jgi:hypothetical protein
MARARFSIGIEMRPNALIFLALILQGARRRSQNSWESRRACKMESATFRTRVRTHTCPVFSVDKPWRCAHRRRARPRHGPRIEADQRVIVMAGRPEHLVAEAYASVFLVESRFAQQSDVARAFARALRAIWHYRERDAPGGMAALGRAGADQYLSGFFDLHGSPRYSCLNRRRFSPWQRQGFLGAHARGAR